MKRETRPHVLEALARVQEFERRQYKMKVLVKFEWDCGRMGDIEGLFICSREELESLYGEQADFGEALGKHSQIHGELEKDNFTIVSEDVEFITKLEEVIGGTSISGYNPFNYLPEE